MIHSTILCVVLGATTAGAGSAAVTSPSNLKAANIQSFTAKYEVHLLPMFQAVAGTAQWGVQRGDDGHLHCNQAVSYFQKKTEDEMKKKWNKDALAKEKAAWEAKKAKLAKMDAEKAKKWEEKLASMSADERAMMEKKMAWKKKVKGMVHAGEIQQEDILLCGATLATINRAEEYYDGTVMEYDVCSSSTIATKTSPESDPEEVGELAMEGPVYDRIGLPLVLASLPLAEGYETELPVLDLHGGGVTLAHIRVVGQEKQFSGPRQGTVGWKVKAKIGGELHNYVISNEAPYLLTWNFDNGFWKLSDL